MTLVYERKRDGYYIARQGTRIVGALETNLVFGRTVAQVSLVEPDMLGQGIGSKLYAMALEDACVNRAPLASDIHRSVFAEGWWRKQARRRRAVCHKGRGGSIYQLPSHELLTHFYRDCKKTYFEAEWASKCASRRLDEVLKRLPEPKKRQGALYWPCERWVIPLVRCTGDRSLSGLRRRR